MDKFIVAANLSVADIIRMRARQVVTTDKINDRVVPHAPVVAKTDWDALDEKYLYTAIDPGGYKYAYTEEPFFNRAFNCWSTPSHALFIGSTGGDYPDYLTSVRMRAR